MSLFDILKNADFGSALDMIAAQAKGVAGNMQKNTPGGLGGLLGAGALGAVLGNLMSSDVVKGVAVAGASAVAWNFYQKWANAQKEGAQAQQGRVGQPAMRQVKNQFGPGATSLDPTVELVVRAMNYAARSDGKIDDLERQRMGQILQNLLPGQNVGEVIETISNEPIDPERIAAETISADQAEDVYRLSCATIDVDQFMEKNYMDALANALGISQKRKGELEAEASMAKKQLMAALPG